MTIEGVLFDYGGVMTTPVGHSIAAWLEADRIEPESFSRTLKAWLSRDVDWNTPIHQLETGELSAEEFQHQFAAELRTLEGGPVDGSGLLGRLFAGMKPDVEMFTLVEDLRAAGIRVGLLSNSWGKTYPYDRLSPLFDPIVISEKVGMRKPQAAIYLHAIELLGLHPERVAFVDDAEPNVIGAKNVGMHGIHHQTAAATRVALAALIPGFRDPQAAGSPEARSPRSSTNEAASSSTDESGAS